MKLLSRQEEWVLLAVWRLAEDAYGVAIRRYLMEATGEHWSLAAVYVPLDRFEKQGYVRSRVGSPTPERGGRSKRYYTITFVGIKALNDVQRINATLWAGFPNPVFDQNG